jgi:HD-GYP domain-containing protein (c-di-GMP phosphodiesterase class II)
MTMDPVHTAGTAGAGQVLAARIILQALYGAIKAAMVYEANNRAYRSRADELHRELQEYLKNHGSLRIDYFNDFLFIDGIRLRYGDKDFAHDRDLGRLFEELQLGRMEFPGIIDPEELDRAVFAIAHLDRRVNDPFGQLQQTWDKLSLQRIVIRRMAPKIADRLSTNSEITGSDNSPRQQAGKLFRRAADLAREFMKPGAEITTAAAAKARRIVHDLIDHIVKDEASLLEFSAIKEFDDYTYVHSTNVCIYSITLGLRLGLDRSRLSQLGFAALFHDIGKTRLSPELIGKAGAYDDADWREIRKHPALGALTLAMMPATDAHNSRAVLVAYEHHLNLDGTGYPPLPTPRELDLFSRIVALTDSYDAMTSGRVYMKTRLSPDEAVHRLLRQSGLRYDAVLLQATIHALGVFPAGTFVRLNTGEYGIVRRNNPLDIFCPEVIVFHVQEHGVIIDRTIQLSARDAETGGYRAYIAEIVDPETLGLTTREALGIEWTETASAAIE